MTLGQAIQKQFGTSAYGKDAFAKQRELYEKMGSPLGKYMGSLQQNLHLLKNQSKWGSYMNPAPTPASAPVAAPQPNAAEQLVKTFTQDTKPVTRFEDIVNPNTVVNESLINQFAQSQVLPQAYIRDADQFRNLKNQQANTGSWRTAGRGGEQQLLNQQAGQRDAELGGMADAQRGNLQNYYNAMKEEYYMDPNAFQLNNFNQQLQDKFKQIKPTITVSDGLIQGFDPMRNYYY